MQLFSSVFLAYIYGERSTSRGVFNVQKSYLNDMFYSLIEAAFDAVVWYNMQCLNKEPMLWCARKKGKKNSGKENDS